MGGGDEEDGAVLVGWEEDGRVGVDVNVNVVVVQVGSSGKGVAWTNIGGRPPSSSFSIASEEFLAPRGCCWSEAEGEEGSNRGTRGGDESPPPLVPPSDDESGGGGG